MDLAFDTVDMTDAEERQKCYDVLAAAHAGLPGPPMPEFAEWDDFIQNMSDFTNYALLTASDGDNMVGAATLSLPDSAEVSDTSLVHVYVLPDHRRQGIGTAFVNHFRESLPKNRPVILAAARTNTESAVALDFARKIGAIERWSTSQFETTSGLDLATVDGYWKELSAELDGYSVRAAVGGLAGNYLEAYLEYVDQTVELDLPEGYDAEAYFEELEELEADESAVLDTIVCDSEGNVVAAQRTLVPPDAADEILVDVPLPVTDLPAPVLAASLAKTFRSLAKFFPRYTDYACMIDDDQGFQEVLTRCGLSYSHTNTNVALTR